MSHDFTVTFLGVRGSIPVPGPSTLKIGGNSSCVQIEILNHTFFLDAGTGIISAGKKLVNTFLTSSSDSHKQLFTSILISHTHHDHIMGLPFFAPLFLQQSHISIFGPSIYGPINYPHTDLQYVLNMLMDQMFFPIDLQETPSIKQIISLKPQNQIVFSPQTSIPELVQQNNFNPTSDQIVISQYRNYAHPKNGVLVYKISFNGKTIVYATDLESYISGDQKLIQFSMNADLLIHDSQYTEEQYMKIPSVQGFGHSTAEMACYVAKKANVKQLLLYHHDPNHSDDEIFKKEIKAKELFPHAQAAYEGLILKI
jgi:ribonuclease BN (tRNA processing enzyme)